MVDRHAGWPALGAVSRAGAGPAWDGAAPIPALGERGKYPRVLGELLRSTTHDILDYFAKCPRCGYAVQASETTKTFSRGLVERTVFRTCGLPCGWSESARSITESPSAL